MLKLSYSLCLSVLLSLTAQAIFQIAGAAERDANWQNYYSLALQASEENHWPKAKNLFNLCLKEAKETSLSKDLRAKSLKGLAEAQAQCDEISSAQATYKELCQLLESSTTDGSPSADLTQAYLAYASCLEASGNMQKAESIYTKILDKPEFVYGQSAPQVYRQSAKFFYSKHKLKRAESLAQKSADLSRKQDSSALEDSLRLLSRIQEENGKSKEAEKTRLELSTIKATASDKPRYSTNGATENTSSSSFADQLNLGKEAGTRLQVNDAQRLVFQAEPSRLSSMWNTLAELSNSQKRFEEAEPLYKRIIAIDEDSLGKDHPGYAGDLCNLALLYLNTGRASLAEPLLEQALSIYLKAYGLQNLAVVNCQLNLAQAAEATKHYEKADSLLTEALKTNRSLSQSGGSSGNNGSFLTAKILNRLGYLYFLEGRYLDSQRIYLEAIQATESALGPNSPLLAACRDDYARVLKAANKQPATLAVP